MPKALDLSGKKFGKLTAISRAENRNKKTYWLCQCDCGNYKEVQTSHLQSGLIQSCGCLNNHFEDRFCLNCGIKLHKAQYKYCSNKCQREYETKQKVQDIFTGKSSGLNNAKTTSPKTRDCLRSYLLKKANYCCEKYGCDWVNPYSQSSILEIHHIDGNRNNNLENNLQVLCPNCHAMTENYRGLNAKNKQK